MRNVIIIGALGRSFHHFNAYFKNNHDYKVVAFVSDEADNIQDKTYPIQLTGKHYPYGISIFQVSDLTFLIKKHDVHECVYSDCDTSFDNLMHLSSQVQACGADFRFLGGNTSMLKSLKPVIAISATSIGSGKSQTSSKLIDLLMKRGLNVVAIKHPMPCGDIKNKITQRFAKPSDLTDNVCTTEEIEQHLPHIERGNVVYSGVDFHDVLKEVEEDSKGCDVIVWEGLKNDMPFLKPDLLITVADPQRLHQVNNYFPSAINIRQSDVVVINKVGTAEPSAVQQLRENIIALNNEATIIEAASPIVADQYHLIRGKKVLIIDKGDAITHGKLKKGAGIIAAEKYGAAEIVDPKPYAVGKIKDVLSNFPDLNNVLPAISYNAEDLKSMEQIINNTPCDLVLIATPIDLSRLIRINKPTLRVEYYLQELGVPNLDVVVEEFVEKFL